MGYHILLLLTKNYNDTEMWLPGQMDEVTDPVSYKVRIDKDGRIFQRHQDQLRKGCIATEHSSQAELSTLDACIFLSTVANSNNGLSTSLIMHQLGIKLTSGIHLTDSHYSYCCLPVLFYNLPPIFVVGRSVI